ncbi:DUF7572 family protein [Gordonia terrae]
MPDVILKRANMSRYCPVTNLYECADGTHLLVTVKDIAAALADSGAIESVAEYLGVADVPIYQSQVPAGVDVYLADERGVVLDADGDPANGMTPLAVLPDTSTHAEALEALGYNVAAADITITEEP